MTLPSASKMCIRDSHYAVLHPQAGGGNVGIGLLGVLAGKQLYADGAKQGAAHEAG